MGGAISRLAEVEEIEPGDVIIAVTGKTGVGKSSFINTAAGQDILPVNHRWKPEPTEVQHVECSNPERYPNRRVVFVEVPAFDSERDEKSVEKKLKKWLKRFSSKRVRITGILYLHRITDTKLSDPPARHLALLKSLCEGSVGGFPDRVMMVTTMWGVLQSHATGLIREEELQKYWDTLPKGSVSSRIMRFENSFDSAWSIVFALLGRLDTRVYEREEREKIEREEREGIERMARERIERERREKPKREAHEALEGVEHLLGHGTSRNMLATYFRLGDAEEKAKEGLAQAMVDFLSQVLDENTLSGPGDRRIALQLLARITKSAQVVPKCLELTGVQCNFREKDRGGYGVIYQGTFEGQTICVKAVRFYLKGENRTASRVCIVSPWMEHGNLAEYVHSSPLPGLELRALFLFDIICGLKYLHNEEIIHGDLKASNVLVTSSLRAVLIDLGASRIIVSTPSTATAAEYQSTPYWMAPELLISEEKAQPTKESDMWAFGCTCYEVLTGEIPFAERKNHTQLVFAFLKGERLGIPQSSPGDKSSIIWSLVQRCCEYDVKKRPSADEATLSLATLVANPPPFDVDWTQLLANLKEKRETRSDGVIIDYDSVYKVLLIIQMASRAKAENQTPPQPTVNPTADKTEEVTLASTASIPSQPMDHEVVSQSALDHEIEHAPVTVNHKAAHTLKPVDREAALVTKPADRGPVNPIRQEEGQSLRSKFKQWFCCRFV
ncbi:Cell division control protein 7 [Leucoagaricus sp. SymC.cos]|nr:Cell division control protein 7 [Leucoagaricus sp. SymC.cos]